ncbi:hypothetical protein [Natronoflexus pectinivorans]|uniref:AsmA-like protein n=1 Tax=Natronoflexus pectinivorans TaxID=682526 RepID=A0A4R2GP46_9BACT|nr:hypothetical protein [Natronoflexus pectinivorans]TCO11093.1 hypothetical protein EV194_101727 [Natronoflexus pectinivorans]
MKNRNARLMLFIALPVLIIALGILYIQAHLPRVLTSYIENLLEEKIAGYLDLSSGDLVDVKVQILNCNMFAATVTTDEISIYAETEVYNEDSSAMSQKVAYEAGVTNLEISLKPLVLIALGFRKFTFNRLKADSIYYNTKSLLDEPLEKLKFHSGAIHFKGKIELPDQESSAIESTSFKNHLFQASNLSIYFPQDLYSFHIASISVDGVMETIHMEKIIALPNYVKEEFYRHVEFETDRIETHLDHLEVKGLRIDKKHGRRELMVSQVDIRNGLIDVLRDRRPAFNEEQRPVMPTRLFATAPINFFVGEINISEVDILYSEFPEDGSDSAFHESSGKVPFKKLKASLSNITNIADSLHKDSIMRISAEAFIFDDAMLRADFIYNLKDINGGYSADVELTEFQFEAINSAIYPLAGIRFAGGIHKSSVLSFTGNDVESRGELYMEWNNLSLNFTPESGKMITGITKYLGKIIYHPSNPNDFNKSPSGDIYFERDIQRFVFNYWWNCYLSGIKNSVIRDFVPI